MSAPGREGAFAARLDAASPGIFPEIRGARRIGFACPQWVESGHQVTQVEQTNEIVRRMNRQTGRELLVECEGRVPDVGRLPGIDGRSMMSKSAGNAIRLSASPEEISSAVRSMYTDPDHLRASDPGRVEGNVVFTYLNAFDEDRAELEELKRRYRRGGLGDMVLKRRLDGILQALLAPVRERRAALAARPDFVRDVIRDGTAKPQAVTQETLEEVKGGLGLFAMG